MSGPSVPRWILLPPFNLHLNFPPAPEPLFSLHAICMICRRGGDRHDLTLCERCKQPIHWTCHWHDGEPGGLASAEELARYWRDDPNDYAMSLCNVCRS